MKGLGMRTTWQEADGRASALLFCLFGSKLQESNDMDGIYRELRLFYFSGTGNSKAAAQWVAGEAEALGLPTRLLDLERLPADALEGLGPGCLVGIFSPTHGFNLPPLVLSFLAQLPRGGGAAAFVVNTRAGMKMGRWFTPGLSGVALLMAAIFLKAKGFRLVGLRPLDMPSNWVSFHPGLRAAVVASILGRCQAILQRSARRVLEGGTDFKGLRSLPIDLALAPVALLYFAAGRFYLAKSFYANADCDHCGLCQRHCPTSSISERGGQLRWSFTCESCMRCLNACPRRAIQTQHGLLALWTWLASGLAIPALGSWLGLSAGFSLAGLLAQALVWWLALWGGYELSAWAARWAFWRALRDRSSLTWWRFWRRYDPRRALARMRRPGR